MCVCVGRCRWEYFDACICKLRNRNDRSASVEVQIERQIMETNVLTKVISSNLFDFYLCVYVKFVVVSLLCLIFIELLFYHFEKNEREKYSIKISNRRERKKTVWPFCRRSKFFLPFTPELISLFLSFVRLAGQTVVVLSLPIFCAFCLQMPGHYYYYLPMVYNYKLTIKMSW